MSSRYLICSMLVSGICTSAIADGITPSPTAVTTAAPAATSVYEKLKPSVVRVTSTDCPSHETRVGTGFSWNQGNNIVTAWHVVGGCNTVTVYTENDNGHVYPAKTSKVLKKADLALLQVSAPAPFQPLDESSSTPVANSTEYFLGYKLDSQSAVGAPLTVGFGGGTLRNYVSHEVASEIQASGAPDLNMSIIFVDNLAPGLSGAPIFDANAKVVGIADGGLEHGTVGMDWAIPHTYLTALLNSTEDIKQSASRLHNAHQFAMDFNSNTDDSDDVACGSYTFHRLHDVSLGDAMHGTDSPIGLQQLMSEFRLGPNDVIFNVYQESSSGATLALPTGSTLESAGAGCSADIPGSSITLAIHLTTFSSQADMFMQATAFQQSALGGSLMGWRPDQNWSTPFTYRFDGFGAQRSYLFKGIMGGNISETFFETLAAKKNFMLHVSAYDDDPPYSNLWQFNMCVAGGFTGLGCADVADKIHAWGTAVIAVHLTTFPLG